MKRKAKTKPVAQKFKGILCRFADGRSEAHNVAYDVHTLTLPHEGSTRKKPLSRTFKESKDNPLIFDEVV